KKTYFVNGHQEHFLVRKFPVKLDKSQAHGYKSFSEFWMGRDETIWIAKMANIPNLLNSKLEGSFYTNLHLSKIIHIGFFFYIAPTYSLPNSKNTNLF